MSSQPERAGRLGLAFSAGLLFSAGLVLSGMTQPLKVLGFLDITAIGKGPFPGLWDPTLAFVMGGAVCVTLLAFGWTHRMAQAPRFADQEKGHFQGSGTRPWPLSWAARSASHCWPLDGHIEWLKPPDSPTNSMSPASDTSICHW